MAAHHTFEDRKGESGMTGIAVSRRTVLAGCAVAGAAGFSRAATAFARTDPSGTNGEIIRKYYAGWEKKDWGQVDVLLADTFTFTSAAPDDHISKSTFKARCWESQAALIQRFELERVTVDGNEAFVKYLCWTKNGKSFRNVEYFRLKDGKVEAIECYFGGPGFPSAANKAQA
jgi:ketosteroid isomerase-like protein